MSDITRGQYRALARRTNRGMEGDNGPRLWRLLARRSRSVSVLVEEDGREVDGFESRSPQGLRAALAPIVAHLTARGILRFRGIEEGRVLGRVISRREAVLADQAAASAFLADLGPLPGTTSRLRAGS